jgi:isoleucyl-tRNA synthetase
MSLWEVSNSVDFSVLESFVLARWQRDHTFARSLARRRDAPRYVFLDGPPFATGLPHYGHVLTSFVKDVVPRYQTMRGFLVPRRWGWDCHGLPVELEVEKELGLAAPTGADAATVAAFNAACRGLVLRYADAWRGVMARLGRWVDLDGAYRTMDADYTESVVWAFAELHRRGLVYEGDKVVAYCTRCQTPLSNFETRLDDAYRPRVDLAVTVRYPRAADGAALLAWTTTPWTLPASAALAVHPDLTYVRMEAPDGDAVWLAEAACERYAAQLRGYVARARVPGRALVGDACRPPFGFFADAVPVLAAPWVTATDGTGVVHLAPAFGEDDAALCASAGVRGANPVGDDGRYDARVGALAGLDVHAAAEPVAAQLAAAGRLFARGEVRHDYPHCWRCDRPLVYRAVASWYVAASRLRAPMVAVNAQVRWVPAELGERRFADWLAGARDWAVSRRRTWGAPVPVWRCAACAAVHVVGSRAELEALSGQPVTDWHRPAVDAHAWPCGCGGTMRRVADVLDCWFESGAMPFAARHAPFAAPADGGPGDFVAEYVAQTRGWFYTMTVLSTALFAAPPFTSALCHGVLLGEDGRKMSKRLRNYTDPMALVAAHGADALRVALLTSGVVDGADTRFAAAAVRDVVRRLHLPWWNALHLVTAYAVGDGWASDPTAATAPTALDRALTSEAELLREEVERAMADLDVARAYHALEEFVTTLSTWYLRLAKPRLWGDGLDADKRAAYDALVGALTQLALVAAPFVPFLADATWAALGHGDSVHLEDWPAARPDRGDADAVAEVRQLRAVVRLGRAAREHGAVKHRQPLRAARVGGLAAATLATHGGLLAVELNVKAVAPLATAATREVVLDYARLGRRLRERVKAVAAAVTAGAYAVDPDGGLRAAGERLGPDEYAWRATARAAPGSASRDGLTVELDLTVDDALAREATARELARAVADLRKRARLRYGAPVVLGVGGDAATLDAVLDEHGGWLAAQCGAVAVARTLLPDAAWTATAEVGGAVVTLTLAPA